MQTYCDVILQIPELTPHSTKQLVTDIGEFPPTPRMGDGRDSWGPRHLLTPALPLTSPLSLAVERVTNSDSLDLAPRDSGLVSLG